MRRAALSLILASTLLFAGAAHALNIGSNYSDKQDYFNAYVGYYDISQTDDTAAQFGLEYRFKSWEFGIRPTLGANVTTDGSLYGYGGINWDIALMKDKLYLVPNFMVGAYSEGDGKDLGGALEFRSGIELDYQFDNMHRIGVAFNHISNASIYDDNPGAETLLINYSVPVGQLFGGK